MIIDQHFLERHRNNRLLAAVIDNPKHLGIGIDQRTAVIFTKEKMNIFGESSVVIFDARKEKIRMQNESGLIFATNIKMHVLSDGDSVIFE